MQEESPGQTMRKLARDIFEGKGEVAPPFVVLFLADKTLFHASFVENQTASEQRDLIREIIGQLGVKTERVFHVMELWYATAAIHDIKAINALQEDAQSNTICERPDRQEMLAVYEEAADEPTQVWYARIHKDAGGKPTLGPWEKAGLPCPTHRRYFPQGSPIQDPGTN